MTFPDARPTTYKGIKMRSRLEATVASHLDEWGYEWQYEARAYAGEGGQYLPDFELRVNGELRSVVEVRGPAQDDPVAALDRMRVVWQSEPDVDLVLIEAERIAADRNDGWPRATFLVLTPGGIGASVFALCACGVVGRRFFYRAGGQVELSGGCRGCGADATVVAYLDPTEHRS